MILVPTGDKNEELADLKTEIKCKLQKIIPEEITTDHTSQNGNKSKKLPKRKFVTFQEETSSVSDFFPRFFEFLFEGDSKRSTNPFHLEETVQEATGEKPLNVFGINKNKYIVEIQSRTAMKAIVTIKDVKGTPCVVSEYAPFDTVRGLIYVKHTDLST